MRRTNVSPTWEEIEAMRQRCLNSFRDRPSMAGMKAIAERLFDDVKTGKLTAIREYRLKGLFYALTDLFGISPKQLRGILDKSEADRRRAKATK